MKEITVFAPATVANIGVGFDILGLAIEQPGDTVTVSFNHTHQTKIISISGTNGSRISNSLEKNTAGVAAVEFLKSIGNTTQGIDISLKKDMPLGSGLGSSGASAVACAVALNELFGNCYSRRELLPFVMQAEAIACGSAHADNVAPSLLGGITLIRSNEKLDIVMLPVPESLFVVVVHPHFEINTKDARAILPKNISIEKMVIQTGNIAGFVASLFSNDLSLLQRSLNDVIVEPIRAKLVPYFESVKQSALENGALGVSLSGSGPSVFTFASNEHEASKIAMSMAASWNKKQIKTDIFISKINKRGATIISRS